jgi:hypothetical protein
MDIADVIIIPGFVLLLAGAIVAVQKTLGVSFLEACLIGGPGGLLLGMLTIAVLGAIGGAKRK